MTLMNSQKKSSRKRPSKKRTRLKKVRSSNYLSALALSVEMKTVSVNPLDVQEGGGHYKDYKIQPVEFAMVNNLDLCQANVVKYVVRFRDKGGLEDLRKARHYLELLANFEYNESV